MQSTNWWTLHDVAAKVRAGSLAPGEVWQACAEQIDRLDSRLNAFITRMETQHPSKVSDGGQAATDGLLAGAPVAVKDLFETAGISTTAGSLFFKDHIPAEDAAVVTKVRAAGAQLIGKTNTHEIALGVTTVNPHYGTCRNPWAPDRIAGGSSGGSAVAVATGMALAALGTDTGGSIRIPASLCGVVGLKPTYGRVSLRGVIPLSWNLDHAGPVARCVADAALMLQVMAGYDEEDPGSADQPTDEFGRLLGRGVSALRIGSAGGAYVQESDPEVLVAVSEAIALLGKLGAQVEEVNLDFLREAALANGLMTQADAATYHRQRLAERPDLFGEDVRRRLEAGRDTSTADYVLARRTQAEIRHRLHGLFSEYDIIALPTTALTAPLIDGGDAVEHARRLTRFTAPFNLAGVPAISVPCGFSRTGLPIGLQLVADSWRESQLIQAASAYERATDWGARSPTRRLKRGTAQVPTSTALGVPLLGPAESLAFLPLAQRIDLAQGFVGDEAAGVFGNTRAPGNIKRDRHATR